MGKRQRQESNQKIRKKNWKKPQDKAAKPALWMFFTLLLVAFLILLSMFCVRQIIKSRENILLSEKGTIKQDSPVSASLLNEKGEKVVLTPQEVQAIVENWSRRIGITVHEQVEGQIAMGEAVKAVDEWLLKMGLSDGILSGNSTVYSSLSIARIKGEKPEMLSPAYSFWEVSVNGDELAGNFYVNAVTGQIFEAYVNLASVRTGVTKEQLLKSFIRLAGLKPKEQKESDDLNETIRQGGKAAILSAVECYGILIDDIDYVEKIRSKIAEEAAMAALGDVEIASNKENWSISAKIADSSMIARVNCFQYMEYTDSGTEYADKSSKQKTVRASHIELVFSLLVEE